MPYQMFEIFLQFIFKSSTWTQGMKNRKREDKMEMFELGFQTKKPKQVLRTADLEAPVSLQTNVFTSHWFQQRLCSVGMGDIWPILLRNSLTVLDFARERDLKRCHKKAHGFGKGAHYSVEEWDKVLLPPYVMYFCNSYIYCFIYLYSHPLWYIQFLWCEWSILASFLQRLSESLCPTLMTEVNTL